MQYWKKCNTFNTPCVYPSWYHRVWYHQLVTIKYLRTYYTRYISTTRDTGKCGFSRFIQYGQLREYHTRTYQDLGPKASTLEWYAIKRAFQFIFSTIVIYYVIAFDSKFCLLVNFILSIWCNCFFICLQKISMV